MHGLIIPLPRPQHVVTDNYSPTSPVYDPDHSPIQIDSDEEEGSRASMSPAPLDIPIVTPASDIFDTEDDEGKNILTEYLNTDKLPTRLCGVYLYPQDYHAWPFLE